MNIRSIGDLGPGERRDLFDRNAGLSTIRGDVHDIIDRVREEGDVAVREYSRKFDDTEVGNLNITDDAARAVDTLDADILDAIEIAAENIRIFHEAQLRTDWIEEFAPGRKLGQRFRPIGRIGAYVPGGTAAYPSSALMTIIPAKVAGVEHVTVSTPPGDPIDPITLAAIDIAGADAVFRIGGAQAIAAMAYGTESVNRVQKIVGPGNRWVTAAKQIVRGTVEIDFLAGPSEILIIADESADPKTIAIDIVAQAEHDANASVVVATDDTSMAEQIEREVHRSIEDRDRSSIIEAAFTNESSGIFVGRSMSEIIVFAEEFAPEHLSLQTADNESIFDRISNAGSVFIGEYTPVAAGDYASGPNHVLPTNGQAKLTGGLSVDTFLRSSTVQELSRDGLESIAEATMTLAKIEGLPAHAESIKRRVRR